MTRRDIFQLRISSEERQMIEALAKSLQRSQSDTIRLLVRGAATGAGLAGKDERQGRSRRPPFSRWAHTRS